MRKTRGLLSFILSWAIIFGSVTPAVADSSTSDQGVSYAEEIVAVEEVTDQVHLILEAAKELPSADNEDLAVLSTTITETQDAINELPKEQQEALEGSVQSLENAGIAVDAMAEARDQIAEGEDIVIEETDGENSWRFINGEYIDDAIAQADIEAEIAKGLAEQYVIEDIMAGEPDSGLADTLPIDQEEKEQESAPEDAVLEDEADVDEVDNASGDQDAYVQKESEEKPESDLLDPIDELPVEENQEVSSDEAATVVVPNVEAFEGAEDADISLEDEVQAMSELTSVKAGNASAILLASNDKIQGIDVSEHQYSIDWAKVKAAGIKYAILRVGYGQDIASQDDKYWAQNVAACESLGIPYGVYIYSYATSAAAVDGEVQHTLRLLKGHNPQLPVFYDMEENSQAALGAATCSQFAERYCSQIAAAGYLTGVYANTNWWNNYLYPFAGKSGYYHWVAQYNTTCTYGGRYESWQYSSSGSVNGINTRVDMNWWYGDLPNNYSSNTQGSGSQSGSASTVTQGSITADDVIAVMSGWIGKNDSDGSHKDIVDLYNSHKPLAVGYAVKYTDSWCDATISAAFIKLNATDMIGGTECGVQRHIELFKNAGIWIEDGTITPQRGDIITFNWDQTTQPNDGFADHIGIVESVSGNTITTIEGNMGSGYVGRRTLSVGNGYIRGYARPNYITATKTVRELAEEVLAGKWGNGADRVSRLTAAGYDAAAVQAEVNAILNGTTVSNITVTFNGNGSTGGSTAIQNMKKTTATALTANGFSRTGYSFKNWNTKADGSGTTYDNKQSVSLSANTTLYAQWTPYVLTINYYPGSATGDSNGKWDGKASPMQIAKANYDATGFATYGLANANGGTWNLTKTGYHNTNIWLVGSTTASKTVNADTKYAKTQDLATALGLNLATGSRAANLYAQMLPNTYTVSFNGNGSTSGSMGAQKHTYDSAQNLTANAFAKTGYSFTGWNTKADGTGTKYTDKASVKNLTATNNGTVTLYAQWAVSKVAVTGVNLDKATAQLTEGEVLTLAVSVLPSNATNKAVSWASSNDNVATVDASGKITAKAAGTASITVKTTDGSKTASCTVTVKAKPIAVTGISLSATSKTMTEGDSAAITASVVPSNATNKTVTWSSSNTGVASVDASGKITAKTPGGATITAKTADGGKTATCVVTVKAKTISVTSVSLNKTTLSMKVGESGSLTSTIAPSNATNKTVAWTSSDTGIATVTSAGVVRAVKAGTTKITVKSSDGGKTATCTVTVVNPDVKATKISLNKANANLNVNGTVALTGTITPTNTTNKKVAWKSSNTSIATVDANGKVTAKAGGTATITVTTADGSNKSATCKINVTGWNGKKYYQSGALVKGQKKIGSYWYMFDMTTGEMKTGWFDHTKTTNPAGGAKKVYYDKNGYLLYGKQKIGSYTYYFNTGSGAMMTGWQTVDGKLVYIDNSGRLALTSNRTGSLSAKDTTNGYEGIYRITLSGMKNFVSTDSVMFGVWSDTNGRDDLKWYTAKKSGTTYIYDVPINNHKTAGKYQVYAFAKDKAGVMYQVKTTTFTVKVFSYYHAPGKYTTKVGKVDYSAVYDYNYYARKYADLRKSYGSNQTAYLTHFVNYGMKEGRQASANFNVQNYKNRYADLKKAYGNNLKSYYLHYINYGVKEKRNGK